ncbi:RNAse P Rpr2/Rpp21/SNM1 subunit domain-containing protein [Colletotrichum sublineola]|uniref:Putative RNAse P Rpr2/Rpp21/SNM1 subunit domain-containing protein n=1 Tax=Colletotrichum sublineola TaxID=1173701 RepID=A0A066X6L6_COLSU|nr:RNAse P Rpr2/Rpp21/SNM1 subunit domain-containing protein [Colletotrichum sublineola]KDN64773.1 putative RNAse P Rpr2/Rpp21/SNM1 subunit domain-containing protein [Colletotrichum sublineola]
MAKPKSESLPNRHAYTRVSYLHQAAAYLATVQSANSDTIINASQARHAPHAVDHEERLKTNETVARRFVSDIRAVSLKAQIRPSPSLKQMMCKYCDSLLLEGKTCSTTVENASKSGKKPWADIMVTKCKTCGNVKRFPVSAPRQKRRPFREQKAVEGLDTTPAVSEMSTGGD